MSAQHDVRREGVRATWLGHATVILDLAGVRIVTDPVLRRRLGVLRRRADLPVHPHVTDVDAVLLSHLHHDHADLPSLRRLGHSPVLTDPENAVWARAHGLVAPDLEADSWHDVADGVSVHLVRADHVSRPMPHRPNAAVGMLVRGSGVTVWFAGDTSLYPEMADLPQIAGAAIDLALLPVGGWGPRLSPGHMGPTEAAEAAAACGARHVVPIHFGTLHPTAWPSARLTWTTTPGDRFVEVLGAWSRATPHLLPVGGAVTVRPEPR